MKSKITLSLLLALTVTNLPNLLAETYIPYLPVKTDLAVSLNESDYSSFDPKGDYSLEVYSSQNATVIVANNSFYGYKFIST